MDGHVGLVARILEALQGQSAFALQALKLKQTRAFHFRLEAQILFLPENDICRVDCQPPIQVLVYIDWSHPSFSKAFG